MIVTLISNETLKRNWKAFALLDAIFAVDSSYRYFSFDCNWDAVRGEEMGSIRDGEGQEAFFLFCREWAIGILTTYELGVRDLRRLARKEWPNVVRDALLEPAFSADQASVIFWSSGLSPEWEAYPNIYKPQAFLEILIGGIPSYVSWANEYYDINISADLAGAVFDDESVVLSALLMAWMPPPDGIATCHCDDC